MKPRSLRMAFIGGALNSAVGRTHTIATQMDGRFELVSGCFSTDPQTNLDTAQQWGVSPARTHRTWEELLIREKGQIDVVVVLTPTPSHYEIVTRSLASGYPVICEKALATTSEEAAKIREELENTEGFLAVTYNYTGYPILRELRSRIQRGELGRVQQCHIEMPQEGFARLGRDDSLPSPQAWRLVDRRIPTLALDLGVHVHQMIGFLTSQRPMRVTALSNRFGHFEQVVDNTMALAHYSDNIDCHIWYGKTSLGNCNGLRVRVYGDAAGAEWYQMNPEVLMISDVRGEKRIIERSSSDLGCAHELRYNRFKPGHPSGFLEAFANHYHDIADSLEAHLRGEGLKSEFVFGIDEAQEGLEMLTAIHDSTRQRRWVDL